MTIVTAVDDVDLERDRSLVVLAQGGDDTAFAALYARYFNRLVRFAAKRVGNLTEAEEIAQEAFTRAYRALPTFGGERRFYPWLCVITSRLCIDSLRRDGRCQVGDVADEPIIDHGFERLEKEGDVAKLNQAMRRLTPRHRDVLDLREREGWSYQHIASHYAVSLGTVEALLWRARRALRREYEGLGGAALSIPFVRRLVVAWRNIDAGHGAVVGALGTAAALGMAVGVSGPVAAAAPAAAAAAPVVRMITTTHSAHVAATAPPAVSLPAAVSSTVNHVTQAGAKAVATVNSGVVWSVGVAQGMTHPTFTQGVQASQVQVYLGPITAGANLPSPVHLPITLHLGH